MVSMTTESSRITKLLKETVVLLCENSLSFTSELHVQALFAITVDRSTIFAVQIDEKIVKNEQSTGGAVSSGTSGVQGRVISEQRPPAARRLALPAPPVSSPVADRSDDTGLAWPLQSPQPIRGGTRLRGPRFPVGRGRGTLRRGHGRGVSTARGAATGVRMTRTAVSSVQFPMSRPRMQVQQRAVRPGGVHFPSQRLALPPATGESAGGSQRHNATAIVRQRAPVPVRQMLPASSVQNSLSPAIMRKPSARLAIMPPAQSPTSSGALSGLRQQSSSVVRPAARQAHPVRVAGAPMGVRRPRLAIMPAPQQSLPAMVVRSPMQPRSTADLSLVPVSKSPPGARQPVQHRLSSAKTMIQSSLKHRAPAVVKQKTSPNLPHLDRPANQQPSFSPVSTQVSLLVKQLLEQRSQQAVAKQTQMKLATVAPSVPSPPQSMQSVAVSITVAAGCNATVVVNSSPSGQPQVSSGIAAGWLSPRTSQLINNAADLSNQSLSCVSSQLQSAMMPSTVAITQQSVVVTSSATAAGSNAASTSSFHASLHHPVAKTLSTSANPGTLASIVAQSCGMIGAQELGVRSLGVTHPPVTQFGTAYLMSPGAQFSPTRLQPAPSQQQVTAVPLYACPTQLASNIPLSPVHRAHATGMERHAGDNVSLTAMQALMLKQPAGTSSEQLAYSPLPYHSPSTANLAQQHVTSPFSPPEQQRHALSCASQSYLLSPVHADDMSNSNWQFLSPTRSCFPVGSGQENSENAAQVSPRQLYLQQMNQSLQKAPSITQSPTSVGVVQQRSQNPPQVTSLQNHMPSVLHPHGLSAAMQGQVFSGHQPKSSQNQQQVSAPVPTSSVQQRNESTPLVTQMQRMHHLMQYHQQSFALNSAVQHGQTVPAQQTLPVLNPQSLMSEAGSHKPQNQTSASQKAVSATEADRDAILEKIKREAYEQVHQVKRQRESSAQQKVAGAALSNHQVASAGTPGEITAHVTIGQLATAVISHAGLVSLPASSADVHHLSGQIASPAGMRPLQVSKQSMSQHSITSKHLESSSPSIRRQTEPASAGHGDILLTDTPQLTLLSSCSGQMASPAAIRSLQLSEHSRSQHTVTSKHLKPSSLSLARQLIRATASHSEAFLTDTPQSSSSSSSSICSGHLVLPAVQVSEPTISLHSVSSASSIFQQNGTNECMSVSSDTSLISASSTSADDILQCQSSSWTSISDEGASAVSSSVADSSSTSVPHDMLFTKEKLLQLKEKVQKKGSVEVDRQKVITAQLSELQTEIASDEETIVDDMKPSSPKLPDILFSDSSTSVFRCSKSGE